jgi:nitrogen fixation protein NifB
VTTVPLPLLPRRPDGGPGRAASIGSRIATHPCYSQDAHRSYARMHLPVAPGCNIQCHYCNRKFDCSNESRPGVTTGLLSPERAVARVRQVRARVPQLSVVGVAGPGEPLANARRTLGVLDRVRRGFPDLTLCLSTNGLTLLDHVDRIVGLGIDHVTVTVNMTDPEVGERIYPWIAHRGRRWTGRDASRVLSEQQLAGIEALASRGVLCKINSVLIPGINDEHLVEVSRTVRGLGAFLHNVMPLVSAPEHGTHYGLTGRRGPAPAELRALQDACEALAPPDGSGPSMGVMRHCRQCRADAVGLLDEDLGQEFAGGTLVDQHFGHAEEFRVYEAGAGYARYLETRRVARYCHGPAACPPGGTPAPLAGENLPAATELLSDCAAVLCSRVGAGPRHRLQEHGIEAVEVYDVVEHAVTQAGRR